MEGTLVLILLVLVMLVGSYLAGAIPLVMPMSEEKLQLISVLGAGLLVGTALAVIIPEGVRSLNTAVTVQTIPSTKKDGVIIEHHEDTSSTDVHSLIGISLVLGFVFMLLVDQCSVSRSRDAEGSPKSAERNITATVGLVVHAAADGVALGAAATTDQAGVEMIVFIAIMLHKAPAAFGLVTFLLHEGLDRNRIRRHLLVFSLSAPLLALLTFFGIGQEGKETLSSVNATGIAMLFSAGTFLYVATVHVLPELTSKNGHSHGSSILETSERKGLRIIELTFLIIGALLPLFLTLGHQH
ncbi:zinc transporter ZIP9 [Zootermopsis nevadensis]|uniref:Zinc transporter ZIP9 n=1 Tax=Zootermopsis nevadensis TaxID=136037 RepID=A0A067QG12_ZOONE|nr:zinc transporter ZIP9 [Zootermopsis nevadensis]KDR06872.1 Zinc transporter ZIP9 [Zootermopsis nevadensis]